MGIGYQWISISSPAGPSITDNSAANCHSVKVSFFRGLAIGRVGIPQISADGVALVASRLDLLATKLKVLQGNGLSLARPRAWSSHPAASIDLPAPPVAAGERVPQAFSTAW